jgi:RHS repeat-associated protein
MSGSEQGAGGVGGLLMANLGANGTNFAAHDGNGNVAALYDANTGTNTAVYEYSPFGKTIRMTGVAARANPFRFSTKYTDDETDWLYYGYRYYNPSTGRWPSRDPIEEPGNELLSDHSTGSSHKDIGACYCFVSNDGLNWFDTDGRSAAQANTSSSGAPRFVNRTTRTATPPFPRCNSFCGYGCILILFDLTVTDASGAPVSGAKVSESITIAGSAGYFNFAPGTGSATTDSKGMFSDTYYACFYSTVGFVSVKQTLTVGTLSGTWYTQMTRPCSVVYGTRMTLQ